MKSTNQLSLYLRICCTYLFLCLLTLPAARAQCPFAAPPTTSPPSNIVTLSILSVKPNSDLEGDDDYVPFYDNHADIFGMINMDGEDFSLPEVEESDFPHWSIVFEKKASGPVMHIVIKIHENDSGLTGDNDVVDVNPAANMKHLELDYDLCANILRDNTGALIGSGQSVIEINAGTASDQATIRFKLDIKDGRPPAENDLALLEADLVQVLFQSQKLISEKPTVLMVRVANSFTTTLNTSVKVDIEGGGLTIHDVFPITIGSGEVLKKYFYLDTPLLFPRTGSAYPVTMWVSVADTANIHLPRGDCRRLNDRNVKQMRWKVVHTPQRYSLMWTKVGTALDGFNFASDAQLQENKALGGAYINGLFPLSQPNHYQAPFSVLPPLTGAVDFLTTILSPFGIPADNVTPFALVLELNGIANLAGCDRLMGVLPNKDWFKRFSYGFLDEVTGLSLGEFAPRAVIFVPQYGDNDPGPCMTLPAHELGHTYGLSTDPTLKDSWVCDFDWPVLGHTACGFADGFDEYTSATHPNGNPSNGIWLRQGNVPVALDSLVNKEQCNSFCMMAGSPANAHLKWESRKKWIDAADYDQLILKLQGKPDPELVYVSGMISFDDQFHLGSIQHIGAGVPDRDTGTGVYAIRFFDRSGKKLIQENRIPVSWTSADFGKQPRPVTFFGLNLELPAKAYQIQIVNRMSSKVLATVQISAKKPTVSWSVGNKVKIKYGDNYLLKWNASDADGDALQYFLLARSNRDEQWFPVSSGWNKEKKYSMSSKPLTPGKYKIKVMASDGVHVSASSELSVEVGN